MCGNLHICSNIFYTSYFLFSSMNISRGNFHSFCTTTKTAKPFSLETLNVCSNHSLQCNDTVLNALIGTTVKQRRNGILQLHTTRISYIAVHTISSLNCRHGTASRNIKIYFTLLPLNYAQHVVHGNTTHVISKNLMSLHSLYNEYVCM